MAGGSFTRALALAEDEELLQQRDLVVDFLRFTYVRHADRIIDLAEQISRFGREQVKGFFLLMIQWIRDLLLYRVDGPEADIVNVDQIDTISRFCDNVPDANLDVMSGLTEHALRLVERNVNVNLLLIVLAHQLGAAMRGDADAALPTSLVKTTLSGQDA
jgi:DNA polymerase-3 subunit delta'